MAFNSIQKETPVLFNLIAINVVIYVAQLAVPAVTEYGALHYYGSSMFRPYQLVTCIFMHDPVITQGHFGFFHILFNMFTLFVFGNILERFWGSKRFLIFYLICGIGASILIELTIGYSAAQTAKHLAALSPGNVPPDQIAQFIADYKQDYTALGASGAIMGVMAAFAYLFPNTALYVYFIPIPIKAKYVVPLLILYDLFGGFYQFSGDDVGHFAHLGGALIGLLLVIYWNKTNRQTMY